MREHARRHLSIVLGGGGTNTAQAFLDALRPFGLGYSWGGYESLAVPVRLADRAIPRREPYNGPLIRLQIWRQDVSDLKADLVAALTAAAAV